MVDLFWWLPLLVLFFFFRSLCFTPLDDESEWMPSRLPPSVYSIGTLRVIDCSACAVFCALQHHQQKALPVVPAAVARFASDAVAASLLFGGVSDALVPLPLLRALPDADALSRDPRVVALVAARDIPPLFAAGALPRRLCFCVPSGPLASRLHFGQRGAAFREAAEGPALAALRAARGSCRWAAWVRSALTCRFEGRTVAPARLAEVTARLFSEANEANGFSEAHGANEVNGFSEAHGNCCAVWEEGAAGLNTPRALETAAKTAAACGVQPRRVALALAADPSAVQRMAAAVEMGFAGFAASAVPAPLFPNADALIGVDAVRAFVAGHSDAAGDAEEAADCAECCDALRAKWTALVASGALIKA